MSASPTLAVCIPTYKRPDQLVRCVRSVIKSAGSREIPIHLADDSCDETNLSAIAELQREYPHVHHHRNPVNLGIDRNILHSVDLCTSRHAWIMGEDDRMTPEALETVLRVLAGGDRPFVYVNYASVDEDLSLVLRERSLPLEVDREESAEDFLAAHAWSAGFIGACVVDMERWRGVKPAPYVGTWFAHVGAIMESLRGRKVYLIAKPLVLNRCGAPGAFTWASSTFDVLGGWRRMVDQLRAFYPAGVCDRAAASFVRAHGIGTIPFFAYLRAGGALDRESWERFVRNGPYPAASRAAAWAMAGLDQRLFQAAAWGLGAVRRRRKRRITGY
ncbi:MAG TPA: glycosyltransferase [Anaeromyxobacteraceae bacterium]|jgi:glycosyltransferase involved in cell wall biosynthesis|nr:glycosyltransferase [Anaeromyxobacteraceae bacterium]